MAGQSVRVFNRTEINIANYVSGPSAWVALLKNVSAAQFREAVLAVRIHRVFAALASGAQINFGVFGAAPTEEDPTEEYWTATAAGAVAPLFQVSLTSSLPAPTSFVPCLLTASNLIPPAATGNNPTAGYLAPFPGFLTVAQQVVGVASGTGDVLVSGDLILKA